MTYDELVEDIARRICLIANENTRLWGAYKGPAQIFISMTTDAILEPTEKMKLAARYWSQDKYGKPIGDDAASGCWNAMLAASPLREKKG